MPEGAGRNSEAAQGGVVMVNGTSGIVGLGVQCQAFICGDLMRMVVEVPEKESAQCN